MDSATFPYRDDQSTRLWQVVESALEDLAANQDVTLTTAMPYVVGHLCRQISEAHAADAAGEHGDTVPARRRAMGDTERFIHGLIAIDPALAVLHAEHLEADGELLPHVWMGDFSRHLLALEERVRAGSGAADEAVLDALLRDLDREMRARSEEVRELIAVSFLENVAEECATTPELRARLGAALAAELDGILRAWGYQPAEAMRTFVWVFNAGGAHFPGAVFSSPEVAEAWIARHSLTGVLTAYPLDQGVYEWAVADGRFRPKKEMTPGLIGGFSSAYQPHDHYEDGVRLA